KVWIWVFCSRPARDSQANFPDWKLNPHRKDRQFKSLFKNANIRPVLLSSHAAKNTPERNVRFGSKADIGASSINVRFTPESGHWNRHVYHLRRSDSGSLGIFAAIRRASSLRLEQSISGGVFSKDEQGTVSSLTLVKGVLKMSLNSITAVRQ